MVGRGEQPSLAPFRFWSKETLARQQLKAHSTRSGGVLASSAGSRDATAAGTLASPRPRSSPSPHSGWGTRPGEEFMIRDRGGGKIDRSQENLPRQGSESPEDSAPAPSQRGAQGAQLLSLLLRPPARSAAGGFWFLSALPLPSPFRGRAFKPLQLLFPVSNRRVAASSRVLRGALPSSTLRHSALWGAGGTAGTGDDPSPPLRRTLGKGTRRRMRNKRSRRWSSDL